MANYRKNLTLSLGPISTQVDLETVAPQTKSGLNRICPIHQVKLNQQYVCLAEDHVVPWGEWLMGIPTEGGYKIADAEARPHVDSVDGLSLVPVPKKDLEASTFEGEGIYYAKPSNPHAEETWAIFNKVVSGPTALVARGALRSGTNTEKLWRVSTFNGYLVLREIKFPENVKPVPETPAVKVDKATFDMVKQFVGKLTTDWEDFDSTDAGAARLQAWLSGGTEIEGGTITEPTKTIDLKDMLSEALKEMA